MDVAQWLYLFYQPYLGEVKARGREGRREGGTERGRAESRKGIRKAGSVDSFHTFFTHSFAMPKSKSMSPQRSSAHHQKEL